MTLDYKNHIKLMKAIGYHRYICLLAYRCAFTIQII